MESGLQLQAITFLGLVLGVIYLGTSIATAIIRKNRRRAPPQPAGAWPLIGHLHLLVGKGLVHRILGAMADKYGSAFSIHLGFHQAFVVSSWQVAKECFTTNDRIISTRPKSLALKLMAYDHRVVGFAPYGSYWREMRKFVVLHLLSAHRLEMLKHVRISEIDFLMKALYEQWAANGGKAPLLVEMKEKIGDLAMNIVLRIIAGKHYDGSNSDESRQCQKALSDFMHLSGLFTISDAIPILGWLDVLNGNWGKMKRAAREADDLLSKWLKEHKEKRLTGRIDEQEKDFIDVMLSAMQTGDLSVVNDTDTVVKSTCLAMILGGNDTTAITMTWALGLLLNNRHVLRKAQDELDIHVGKHRQVHESDITNLVYLQAIVKETQRLHPALPMSAAREAMADCSIAGFHIPAGTHLLVNLWKLQRDPSVWSEPLEFRPERFLTQQRNVDVRGQHFELMPFGSGRRICPGITFAQQVMHLTLARLLQGFEIETAAGLPVDMAESPGLAVPKATPLEVLLTPRLSPALYKC